MDRPFIIEPVTLLGFPQRDGETHEETIYRRADHSDSARRRAGRGVTGTVGSSSLTGDTGIH